ncbi:MAG: hypothetical protein M3R14_14085 [Acidobacteriota bacterium]|nr:hypothetical protein [Acidobacteriota bacterium]
MFNNQKISIASGAAFILAAIFWNITLNWFALGATGTSLKTAFATGSLYWLFMLLIFLPSLAPFGIGIWLVLRCPKEVHKEGRK